jgi:hypothetical protein
MFILNSGFPSPALALRPGMTNSNFQSIINDALTNVATFENLFIENSFLSASRQGKLKIDY